MKYSDRYEDNCGIYVITNTVNNKRYIGQSHNIQWRWWMHRYQLRRGTQINRHLQSAWNKYGEEAFTFSILELCPENKLNEREIYWIEYFQTTNNLFGYNIMSGGGASRARPMSDEARKHISDALKGKKKPAGVGALISQRQKEYYKTHLPIKSRVVVLLNTGEYFDNAARAHESYPSADISALHEQCKGKHLSCGKSQDGQYLVWAYMEDYLLMDIADIEKAILAPTLPKGRAVICTTTGERFDSIQAAADYYHMHASNISACFNGNQKHAGTHPVTGEKLSWARAS